MSLPGYLPKSKQIMPLEGTRLTVEETLLGTSGSLTIRPTPSEAHVFVDGKDKGQGTVSAQGLPMDEQIPVRVELVGYETHEAQIKLQAEEPMQTLNITLEQSKGRNNRRRSAPATRKVVLQAPYGTWANIYYKGQRIGTTPTEATLPIGKVKLQVRNDEAKIDKNIVVNISRSGDGRIKLKF